MKHHTKKTLSERLAKRRQEGAEASGSEENPPATRSFEKVLRPPKRELEEMHFTSKDTIASRTLNENPGVWASIQQTCRAILDEALPGLVNSLHDRSRRRRSIKGFKLSRSSRPQKAESPLDQQEKKRPAENEEPARALPKLSIPQARRARVIAWRVVRPVLRWHRRASVGAALATCFGIFGVASVAATVYFLIPGRSQQPVAQVVVPSADAPMLLNGSGRKFLSASRTTDSARLQSQAEKEFCSGNYAAAEIHFREALPSARFRALTGFQIFLCLLKQGKTAEAEILARKFPAGSSAKNPSGICVQAAFALMQSRPDDARRHIESARRQFPLISPLYEKALNDASLAPAP